MKKILTFFLLISTVLLFNTLFAQQNSLFPDSIAFWIEQSEDQCADPGGCCGGLHSPCLWLTVTCSKYKMEGDTIINTYQYKKVYKSYNSGTYYPCSYPSIGGNYSSDIYFGGLRKDSLKIFFLYGSDTTECLLYDFSIQEGDTTQIYSYVNSGYDVIFSYDSTYTDTLYGKLRVIRRMSANVYRNNNFQFNFVDDWVEGIGSTHGFIWLPYYYLYKNRTCLATYSELKDFALFNDSLSYQCRDSIFLNPPYYVSTEQFLINRLSISPNPTSQNLTLNISNEHSVSFIRITDIQGKMLKTYNGFQQNISVADLDDGLYFVQVQFANGETAVKKIIKQ